MCDGASQACPFTVNTIIASLLEDSHRDGGHSIGVAPPCKVILETILAIARGTQ